MADLCRQLDHDRAAVFVGRQQAQSILARHVVDPCIRALQHRDGGHGALAMPCLLSAYEVHRQHQRTLSMSRARPCAWSRDQPLEIKSFIVTKM